MASGPFHGDQTAAPVRNAETGVSSGLAAVGIALLTLVVFAPAVGFGFVNWDDDKYVYENPVVTGGVTADTLSAAWTRMFSGNWAPITMLSYQFDALVYGVEPWGFHLTNVVLHALAAGLLGWFLSLATGQPGRAAVVAALFAVHPLRVESVAWISERKDVLAMVALVLTLIAYEWYCRRPGAGRLSVVAGAMLGGLLCKATTVTLPVLLLLLDVWPFGRLRLGTAAAGCLEGGRWARYPRRTLGECLREKLPLVGVAIVFAGVTLVTQARAGAVNDETATPLLGSRIPTVVYGLSWYAWKTLIPTGLGCFHPRPEAGFSAGTIGLCAAGVGVLITLSVVTAGRVPAVCWGICWYLVALAPVSGIIAVGSHCVADRYAYIPHVGLLVALVWGALECARVMRIPARVTDATAVVVLGGWIWTTEAILPAWKNSAALWNHALTVDDRNHLAHAKLGAACVKRGEYESARRHFLIALEASGGAENVCARLAGLHFDLGEYEEARILRDRAISAAPDGEFTRWIVKRMRNGPRRAVGPDVEALLRTGLAAARAGRFADAVEVFGQAARIDPECGDAFNNLGLALGELERYEAARHALAQAVSLNPQHADFRFNHAVALARLGRRREALRECEVAQTLDPTDEAIAQTVAELSGQGR